MIGRVESCIIACRVVGVAPWRAVRVAITIVLVFQELLSISSVGLLLKWLIDLIKQLLLKVIVLNQFADTSKTLGNLVGWESTHQVEHGLGHVVLRLHHLLFREAC